MDMIKNSIKKLILLTLLMLCIQNNSNAMIFSDISKDFWAYNEIEYLLQEKVIDGYIGEYYSPNKNITRAEFSAMIIKALDQEDVETSSIYSFDDVNYHHWAWKYILAAVYLDILKPSDNHFYPDDYITRGEMITFLVNILKTEDITKQEALSALKNAYLDYDDIPDWFKVTAGKAEVIDVIAKPPQREKFLDYDKFMTRAEAAVFITKMKKLNDFYLAEMIKEKTSPKMGEGIEIANVRINGDIAVLPAQSVLPIMVLGQISSKDDIPGQMFKACFPNNIVDYEHHLILDKNTILIGKILDTKKAKLFLKNGGIVFELSAANKKNVITKIFAAAEYEASIIEANKIKKVVKTIIKGNNFIAKDGQILYIKLFQPLKINVVTGEILG